MLTKSLRAKRTALIIAFVMLMMTGLGTLNASYATLYKNPAAVQTDSIASSSSNTDEYYKVTTPLDEKSVIYVEGKTKIDTKRFCIRLMPHGSTTAKITVFVVPDSNGEFSVKISTKQGNTQTPEAYKGTVAQADESWDTRPGYRAVEQIPAGIYHLTIARATTAKDANISKGSNWWNGTLGGGKGYAYKEVVMTVAKGQANNPKVVKYTAAVTNNNNTTKSLEKNSTHDAAYKGSYVRYTDTYMKDMSFVFKNPKTGKQENMTAAKVKYVKGVADEVTAGAETDYEKLLKIYEYVAENFYYDVLANEAYKNQYANPYNNLYNLRNKVNTANSKGGKVATTCQGYGSLVIALARAEGIPARLAYGHHISQPITVWDKYSGKISERDHWWTEAWLADEGRWVFIDANSATSSKWERKSFSAAGTWTKGNGINYVHFDPTAEQLSASYAYTGIYPGATGGQFISNKNEVKQLKAFLNTKSGKTNGKKLNAKYSPTNYATWGTTAADDFLTDGYGRVTHILWGNKNLTGQMNLSNFKQLKYLTVYNNKIKTLNLTGCSSLQKISATYTKITKFDSSASKNTTSITTKGNKLTNAKFKNGNKTITISRNVAGGTFAFDYTKSKAKSVTIYVNDPAKGYKYLGIYNGSGKKLSSAKTYTFKPTAAKYVVKYKKK